MDLQLNQVLDTLQEQHVQLTIEEEVKAYLTRNGYEPQYGARPIKRIIKQKILSQLARAMLENPDVKHFTVVMKAGEIIIRIPEDYRAVA